MPEVTAQPYPYTFGVASTALVVIDMQRDFIERGGFGEALGNDVSRLAAIVPTVRALLAWARGAGIRVLHTREGHRADLGDCPPAKLRRGDPRLRIGAKGPMGRILVDGEPGNDIVPDLAPLPSETVIARAKDPSSAAEARLERRTATPSSIARPRPPSMKLSATARAGITDGGRKAFTCAV